jgi:ABC-2 type transport system ATP-binding protein
MSEVIINGLTKTYDKGKVQALENINLHVKSGELFGIIGPDGAGKSTLFRILTTLLLPDSGSASVASHDIVKNVYDIRKISGYMPGKFSLYQDLSIEENLHFFATVFGTTVAENYDMIKDIYVQLEPFKNRPAGKLSGGMKQKLALCCALIHEPKILFLDEPTTGVDPVSRKEFWDMLDKLKERGITILVSTPYMDEASRCDRIALIQKGRIFKVDTLNNIEASYRDELYAFKADNMYKLLKTLRANNHIKSCFAFGENHHVCFKEKINIETQLIPELIREGLSNISFQKIKPTIEDVFIQIIEE